MVRHPEVANVAATYGEAVQKVLELIKKTRDGKFYNYREGQLGPRYLRQSAKSAKMFQKFGEEQKDHDILVIPAQFGHPSQRPFGPQGARSHERQSEFGLGAFAIGIMLLTHPERLQNYDDLCIDCAGDEYSPGGRWRCSPSAPFFGFGDGGVGFGTNWVVMRAATLARRRLPFRSNRTLIARMLGSFDILSS